MESVGDDEPWHQYWRDNGEQLVWNDWLQKYPEYNSSSCVDDSHSSAAELTNKSETGQMTHQLCKNTDSAVNEDGVSVSNGCDVVGEVMTSFVNGQTCCLDVKRLEFSQSVDPESRVEDDRQLTDSSRNSRSVSDRDNDSADSSTADVLEQSQSPRSDISDGQVIVADHTHDTVEFSGGANDVRSWERLWKQHYAETCWYYYDWYMQWMQEEREMSQPSGPTDDIVQQIATETYGLADDSSYACSDYVVTSQESLSVVENLLSEMLLSVVEQSVDHHCPADGNSQKHKRNRGKQPEHGLFEITHLSFILSASQCIR